MRPDTLRRWQFYKIDGATWRAWMQILRSANSSVLWLRSESDEAHSALRGFAQEAGVDPERVQFAKWAATTDQHLERF